MADSLQRRSAALDLFKTMLVIGMITAHVIQLISSRLPFAADVVSEYVNLTTFSGFMLAFGLGIGMSSGRQKPLLARLRPVLLLLLAAYVSSLTFVVLVDHKNLTGPLLLDLFSLSKLFGWSEFLASFAVLYLLIALLRPGFVAVATRPWLLALAIALCFASTWIVVGFDFPAIATLVGTKNFASFPLLAYLPWFLVGIALGRRNGQAAPWHYGVALLLTAAFCLVWWKTGTEPGRFPPTVLYVVGPALVLLAYLALAKALDQRFALPGWITLPGRHVLSFLLLSNLTIFALRRWFDHPLHYAAAVAGVAALIILVIGLGWLLVDRLRTPAG